MTYTPETPDESKIWLSLSNRQKKKMENLSTEAIKICIFTTELINSATSDLSDELRADFKQKFDEISTQLNVITTMLKLKDQGTQDEISTQLNKITTMLDSVGITKEQAVSEGSTLQARQQIVEEFKSDLRATLSSSGQIPGQVPSQLLDDAWEAVQRINATPEPEPVPDKIVKVAGTQRYYRPRYNYSTHTYDPAPTSDKFYDVNLTKGTCSCPDFTYRGGNGYECKHFSKARATQ